jgi:DNA-binding NarL/FixJ family response regulator
MKKKVAIKPVGALGAQSAIQEPDRRMVGKQPQRGEGLGEGRRHIRVLVVCKSLLLGDTVGRFLQGLGGFKVVGSASDGQEAVRQAAEAGADLVLMDMHMPRMDGLEATRKIKGRRGAPVVILCALDEGGQMRAAAKIAEADAFVPKAPKMFTTLPAAIRRAFPGVSFSWSRSRARQPRVD